VSPALQQLLPTLVQPWAQAKSPLEQLEVLMAHCPVRGVTSRLGYEPGNPVQSVHMLLSTGLKVGTDAFKADTAVAEFAQLAQRLQKLMSQIPGGVSVVPYSSGALDKLQNNRFNVAEALENLQHNPTLSAGVMEMALTTLGQPRIEAVGQAALHSAARESA
jgi:hypothetical protein